MIGKVFAALGGVYGFVAVALGAVGVHVLKPHATDTVMFIYHTAESYNFYHALALVGVGLAAQMRHSIWLVISGGCFAAGVLLFCGSLYALALTGLAASLAPAGGVLLMLGWLSLALGMLRPATKV